MNERSLGQPENTPWARRFKLSKRQAQVIALRLRHYSIREAGELLEISEHTARRHDAIARGKAGVTTFGDLARNVRRMERRAKLIH